MEHGLEPSIQRNTILDLVTTVYREGVNNGAITSTDITMKPTNNGRKTTIQDQVIQKQRQLMAIMLVDHVIITVVA